MPRRDYLVYFDSNVLSVAADPRRSKDDPHSIALIRQAAKYCTFVYSKTVVKECGPERSVEPRLARRRLALLRGANRRMLVFDNTIAVEKAAELLRKANRSNESQSSALFRDAMHLASAIHSGVNLLVTNNIKDFRLLCRTEEGAPVQLAGVRVVRPAEASALMASNPPPRSAHRKRQRLIRGMVPTTAELYARRQYWSMRDWGYSPKEAQAYIKRKWTITVREPRRASA